VERIARCCFAAAVYFPCLFWNCEYVVGLQEFGSGAEPTGLTVLRLLDKEARWTPALSRFFASWRTALRRSARRFTPNARRPLPFGSRWSRCCASTGNSGTP